MAKAAGEKVFGNWTVKELLGEGAFGKVYRIEREDFGTLYQAAMKKIVIPQSEKEIQEALGEGMDMQSVTGYFRSFVEEIVNEFKLMAQMKGNTNIVSYEDHLAMPHEDGIGWDILIRMELLESLQDLTEKRALTEQEVIKLGIDMCNALEVCGKLGIIHRDIKPGNIFISSLGDFKLGDFGIARTAEKTMSNLSRKGTYTYMAPEVYKGEAYNAAVDIYSLGIVMYRFLNYNRAPFLPAYPEPITFSDREASLTRRISGEAIAPPACGSKELKEVVLKACAYHPSGRYGSPVQMREALLEILHDKKKGTMEVPKLSREEEKREWKEEEAASARKTQEEQTEERTAGIFRKDAVSERKTEEVPEEKQKEKPDKRQDERPKEKLARRQDERPKEKPKQQNISAVKESGKDYGKAESILRGILIGLGILNVYEIIVGLAVLMVITLPLWIIVLLIWLKVRKKKEKGENQYGKN